MTYARRLLGLAALTLLLLMAAAPTFASPSLFGPTGLLRVPTADTLAPPGLDFAAYWSSDVATTLIMNVGVVPKVEVSAAWVDPEGDAASTIISGKWQIMTEADRGFALAVGLYDASGEINRTLFGVAQKHLTVGNTRVRVVGGLATEHSLVDGFFAGAEILLGRGYSAIVEYDGDNTNAALRGPLGPDLEFTAGTVGERLSVGARYTIR